MAVSVKTDLRARVGSARDQGQRPTCLAFAASDAHGVSRNLSVELSPEHAFYSAHQRAGTNPTRGAQLTEILQVIQRDGQVPETDWPYLPVLPTKIADWKPPKTFSTFYLRASAPVYLSWNSAVQQIDNSVPVLVTLRLSDSFYEPNADGVVDQVGSQTGDPNRRHAVVGIGTGMYGKQQVLLVRNSWGRSWGLSGYAWLTEAFVTTRLDNLTVFIGDPNVRSH